MTTRRIYYMFRLIYHFVFQPFSIIVITERMLFSIVLQKESAPSRFVVERDVPHRGSESLTQTCMCVTHGDHICSHNCPPRWPTFASRRHRRSPDLLRRDETT